MIANPKKVRTPRALRGRQHKDCESACCHCGRLFDNRGYGRSYLARTLTHRICPSCAE